MVTKKDNFEFDTGAYRVKRTTASRTTTVSRSTGGKTTEPWNEVCIILVPMALFVSLNVRSLGTVQRSEKGNGDKNGFILVASVICYNPCRVHCTTKENYNLGLRLWCVRSPIVI